MEISFQTKGIFNIKMVHTDDISICNRNDAMAAGYVCREYLKKGASVIVYGKKHDIYRYIKDDYEPKVISTITTDKIKKELAYPFIKNINEKAVRTIDNIFGETGFNHILGYLKKDSTNKERILLQNPLNEQTYYQINTNSIKADNICCEVFLSCILSQALEEIPVKSLVLLIDAPYKPMSTISLELIEIAAVQKYITVICMYDEMGADYNRSKYNLHSEKDIIYLNNKKILI